MTEESVDVVVCAASHFASAAYCAQSGSRCQRITRSRRSLIRHGERAKYRIRYAEPLDFYIICYHCSEWFLLLDTETTEQRIFSTMAKKRTESRMVTYPLATEMYSVKQVAESLSLSTSTIQDAIEAGNLKAKKTGKQLLITREAVREYFDSLPESRRHKKAKWGYVRDACLCRFGHKHVLRTYPYH